MAAAVFNINAGGWCEGARWAPSPNCDARPPEAAVSLLLVHNISLPPDEFGGPYIADLFANRLDYEAHPYFDQLRSLRVSAHFLIGRDGAVTQFVSADDRAWHAGVSVYAGRERCNDFSIGIEVEGSDFRPFDEAQYSALAALTEALLKHYPITDLAGHEHVAPGRKTDPGPYFDWVRYRESLCRSGLRQVNGALPRMPIA
ncbi:1,6-anhydro-N-acetylmuramyl-L-alanine amidase AmpD [Oxalobacteraceae bacterium CAVE-383]|nr:1,6-anhydro-N-acetylmuramyl-L-alanine amidase AmpD [Oxalobacteraceae bacterium CAVE-383]